MFKLGKQNRVTNELTKGLSDGCPSWAAVAAKSTPLVKPNCWSVSQTNISKISKNTFAQVYGTKLHNLGVKITWIQRHGIFICPN